MLLRYGLTKRPTLTWLLLTNSAYLLVFVFSGNGKKRSQPFPNPLPRCQLPIQSSLHHEP